MTALTARINSTAADLAFLRGLLVGVVAAALVTAAIVAAVWFASQPAAPAGAPAFHQAPAQIDEHNPVQRGPVKVF
jgi:hypothetical protein